MCSFQRLKISWCLQTPALSPFPDLTQPEVAFPLGKQGIDPDCIARMGGVYLQNLDMPQLLQKAHVAIVLKAREMLTANPNRKLPYIVLDLPCTFFMLRSLRCVLLTRSFAGIRCIVERWPGLATTRHLLHPDAAALANTGIDLSNSPIATMLIDLPQSPPHVHKLKSANPCPYRFIPACSLPVQCKSMPGLPRQCCTPNSHLNGAAVWGHLGIVCAHCPSSPSSS